MIDLNITMDLSQLVNWEVVTKKEIKEGLQAAAASYMLDQRKNMRRGVDVNGAKFAKYSKRYLDLKTRAGRMSGPSGSVDNIKGASSYWLRLTGQMMRSQKVRFKIAAKGGTATIAFEGMQAPAAFSSSGRASKYATSGKDIKRAQRARDDRRLVVNFTKGDMQSSAFIAWKNDRIRKFVGMNPKMMRNAFKAFGAVIRRSPGAVKFRNA